MAEVIEKTDTMTGHGSDFDSAIPRFESWRPSQPKMQCLKVPASRGLLYMQKVLRAKTADSLAFPSAPEWSVQHGRR
jgi:hypothetical protein